MSKLNKIQPGMLPVVGISFASFYWFVDSAIDTFVFQSQRLYLEDLLRPDSIELIARCQVVFLLIALSVIAMFLLKKQQEINCKLRGTSDLLRKHQYELVQLVDERTHELMLKNTSLEKEIDERKKAEAKLFVLSTTDALTGVYNRRKFNEELKSELDRNLRYDTDLSLLIFDIDHFKLINDTHGHQTGDNILEEFTQLIADNIRSSDIFARWGGDEFAILLPETTPESAQELAEKLRDITSKHFYPYVGKITASFGLTHCLKGDNEKTFLKRADHAMYQAKKDGRNRTVVLPHIGVKLESVSNVTKIA